VANYSVDIALAVRGSEKAAREIKKLEKLIDNIGKKAAIDLGGQVRLKGEQRLLQEKIKNFQISRRELKNSQEIARLTNQRIKGLSQYANSIGPQVDRIAQAQKRAVQEQIQGQQRYNKLVDQTLAKLSRIAEVNRKASQYPSPIGPPRGGRTQYPGQIGPGQASQANVPQGPFSRLIDRPRRNAGMGGGFLRSRLGQNLALGGGFPLLFGGGAGSIAGGLLGSAGGFGGQILGSALGQQLDQFAQKTTDLSQALEGAGDVTQALESFIGRLNSETSRRIKNLQQSGQVAKAADAAFKELSQTIGVDNARALVQAGQDFETLGNKTAQFFAIVGASVASLFQEAFYLNTGDPLSGTPSATPELSLSRTQAAQSLQMSQLQTAALRAQGTGSLEEAAEADKKVVRQQKINDLKEFDRKVTEGLKDETKDIAEREKIIEDAKRAILQIDLQLLDATKQRTKETERLAEQARREQEAARKRFEQEQKQRRSQYDSAVVSNATQSNVLMQLQQQLTALEEGESAALQKRLNDLSDIAANEKTILDIRYEASKGNAKSVEEQGQLYAAYYRQVQALNTRVAIERRGIAEAQSRIRLEKELLSLQQQQALRGIQTGIGRQIKDANLRPTGSMAQDQEIALRIDQIRRQKDAELELTDAIEAQKVIRDSVTSDENIQKAVDEIGRLEERLALTKELLPQLDAAEQAQLKFNQTLEAAKPFADAFTSGLLDGMVAVVDGTKTAEQAFADFLNSIAKMLLQTAQQMIAQYIALGIARMFAGMGSYQMSGGGMPFGGSGAAPAGLSTSFIGSPLFGRANGGPVTGNRPYLVGERGPELFVPGAQGNIVPNSAMGATNIVVNVDANSTNAQGDNQDGKRLGAAIGAAVQAELVKQKRPGGLLAS
tara:strand:- start:7004 stop:9682 length:2679 start_codon:yes stop_codon:yes gene_type:complete